MVNTSCFDIKLSLILCECTGVTSIDTTAIEGLLELNKMLEKNGIEVPHGYVVVVPLD